MTYFWFDEDGRWRFGQEGRRRPHAPYASYAEGAGRVPAGAMR